MFLCTNEVELGIKDGSINFKRGMFKENLKWK